MTFFGLGWNVIFSDLLTIAVKIEISVPNDDMQNYPFCRLKLVVGKYLSFNLRNLLRIYVQI